MFPSPKTEEKSTARRFSAVAALAGLLVLLPQVTIGAGAPNEEELKAAFLFNFAQFTRWPAVVPGTPLKFCLYQDSLNAEARAVLRDKQIADRNTIIQIFDVLNAPEDCNVIYVGRQYGENEACEIAARQAAGSVLTVSDRDGFDACGGHITIATINNRLRFIVNLQSVQASNLALSAQLLELAIVRNANP